jgi:hypothetical protein
MNYMDANVVESLLPTTGFAGSPAELRDLLARVEDLGADEVLLTPTCASADEVSRIAEIVG